MIRQLLLTAATVVCLTIAAARPSLPQAPQSYTIALTVPLTGPLAANTAEYTPGAEIAVAEMNKAGGIRGHHVNLIVEDSQATPQGGVTAMRKVVQVNGALGVITIYTNVTTAEMPLADQLKVPLLAAVESPGVMGRSPFSFAHASRFTLVQPLLRDYWRKTHVKRVFAFLGNNAQGNAYSPLVRATAQDVGAEYSEALINLGDADFRGVIVRAKEFNPDAIFINTSGSSAETTTIRQIRELGMTTQLFEDSNFFQSQAWRNAVGPYSEGMVFGGLNVDPTHAAAFVKAYRERTGHPPGYVPALFYDMVKMLAYAIGKSPSNPEEQRAALEHLSGVPSIFGGSITMGPDHYTVNSSVALWQVKLGREVRISER